MQLPPALDRRDEVGREARGAYHKRQSQMLQRKSYAASRRARHLRFEKLLPAEREERSELRPYFVLATFWSVTTCVLISIGAFTFPLQYRQYQIHGLALFPVRFYIYWQCSVLRCSASMDHSADLCWLLSSVPDYKNVIDSVTSTAGPLCEGNAWVMFTLTMHSLCEGSTKLFMGKTCGTKEGTPGHHNFIDKLVIASSLTLVLAVIALSTHIIVLWFIVRDHQVFIAPEKVVPRRQQSKTLRLVAKRCAIIPGIACVAIGLIYQTVFSVWVEFDGGFLKHTKAGMMFPRPDDPFPLSPGIVIWVTLGILDAGVVAMTCKPLFRGPYEPVGAQMAEVQMADAPQTHRGIQVGHQAAYPASAAPAHVGMTGPPIQGWGAPYAQPLRPHF